MRFTFPNSHAFSGGRMSVEKDEAPEPGCIVEFGDGSTVLASFTRSGDGYSLSIPAYRTARGNTVQPRTWRVVRSADGEWRSMRR